MEELLLATLKRAIIGKAVRLLKLPRAALGTHGEFGEGAVGVRRDRNIEELLSGVLLSDLPDELDLSTLVHADDVILALGQEPSTYPTGKRDEVEDALAAAVFKVYQEIESPLGLA